MLAFIPGRRDLRTAMRFTTVLPVHIRAPDFAEVTAIARNISSSGMLVETSVSLLLGSEVEVRFEIPDSHASIRVRAEVKNHYAFNYVQRGAIVSARGIGVRFQEFIEDGGELLRLSLTRMRTLH
jgi:hypothetical protein